MSAGKLNELMQLWAATLPEDEDPPFADHNDLQAAIDEIAEGEVPWQAFTVSYNGALPEGEVPSWMTRQYEVWFRCPRELGKNMLANSDFAKEMDFVPKRVFGEGGVREFKDLMSGNWVWNQAVSAPVYIDCVR